MSRHERDALGGPDLPDDSSHGIHTARASENFPLAGRSVHRNLARPFGGTLAGAVVVVALDFVRREGA